MNINNKKPDYPPFQDWEWRSYDGKEKVDIRSFMESKKNCQFFVGTDSQNYRKNKRCCVFTTVIIAYTLGKGGSIILHSDKMPYMEHLRQRLLLEAMRSLETAWFIDSVVKKNSVVTIHLDVNGNLRYKSAQYKDELVGMIMAQGYKCIHKPNAWAASSVADAKT